MHPIIDLSMDHPAVAIALLTVLVLMALMAALWPMDRY